MRTRVFLILIFFGLLITSQANAEELSKELSANEAKSGTKIMISTSGPTEFKSYSLENPYRIVVEFQSQNVISDMDREIVVADGLIKKITSSYFEKGNRKAVKMLTFELSKQASYKISQEDDAIVLSIQAPLEIPAFNISSNGIFEVAENSNNIRRLEVMDAVLKQAKEIQSSSIAPAAETSQPGVISKGSIEKNRQIPIQQRVFWFLGLILSLGFSIWYRFNTINKSKKMNRQIEEFKLNAQKKEVLLGQEETLRKAIEKAAIEKEKKYKELQLQLQETTKRLKHEENLLREKETALSEKNKECQLLKNSCESFKDTLVKRGLAKELISAEGRRELWISGKSPEKRALLRLPLTKDFHNTVILKIESSGVSGQIKSFAENISSGGLCFESSYDLNTKQPISLRLFFYGGKVPNLKTHAWIAWKKVVDSKSYYGVSFEDLSEKVKSELKSYIESNATETAVCSPA